MQSQKSTSAVLCAACKCLTDETLSGTMRTPLEMRRKVAMSRTMTMTMTTTMRVTLKRE